MKPATLNLIARFITCLIMALLGLLATATIHWFFGYNFWPTSRDEYAGSLSVVGIAVFVYVWWSWS